MNILALLPLAIVAAPTDAAPRTKLCTPSAKQATADTTLRMRKLGDMPDASAIRTVYNEVDGCPTPIVLRDGIGSNPKAPHTSADGQARPIPLR